MLTSPVNVTIAAANGAALKANIATSDHGAQREPVPVPHPQPAPEGSVVEPELPSNSPLTHMNAVTATVGNRTVLQELSLNVAAMLRIVRKTDENLTSLFLRIIATIETMPQAERLQFEIRAGLKPLKITLSDLVMALRKPDGQEAARLTAIAEAPAAVPGRTAVSAATTTYLEEGTSTGHTEETLAMRAAARNSAAGQSVFSAESKVRAADTQPANAKILQDHLKAMFEPGESPVAAEPEAVLAAVDEFAEALIALAEPDAEPAALPGAEPAALAGAEPAEIRRAAVLPAGEHIAISSANLRLDQPTVDKIRNAAQAIASQSVESARAEPDRAATEKTEAGDRRLQTLLTLKGFAEVMSTIPSKAAELLASVVAEAAAPLPDRAEPEDHVTSTPRPDHADETALPEFAALPEEKATEAAVDPVVTEAIAAEARPENGTPVEETIEAQAEAAGERQAAETDMPPQSRTDLAQHAVPFSYAQPQPAREPMTETAAEEETRGEGEEDDGQRDEEPGDNRRPRDEYDAIHDPQPEEEPAIAITRDSSEADRAFALYQRMGGF